MHEALIPEARSEFYSHTLCRQHAVPSLHPQRRDEPDTNGPHHAADPAQPAVCLKPDIGDVVRRAAGDVAEAQGVEGGSAHTRVVGRRDARGEVADGLEAVFRGGLGAEDELLLLVGVC
ncbi:hypothetical protein CEP51_012959 [Fusarium floridanum]|uniref:Uncharacterized protein n=1 Tax=Fusarium floridanum TaxID=1325733 RepID=A0A428QK48_9HYPO|nr:hypothetical protein CEP51_012959 [Fusarium floridanum]